MITSRIKQMRRSFEWEVRRFGHHFYNGAEMDSPLMEFEDDTVSLTTDKEALRLPVEEAAKRLWTIKARKVTADELMFILRGKP